MNKGKGRMTAIICGIILFINIGGSSIASLVLPNITEHIGKGSAAVSLALSLGTFSGAVLGMIGGKIIKKLTPRGALIAGSLLVGVNLTLYVMADNLPILYLGGLLSGGVLALGAHASIGAIVSGRYGAAAAPLLGVIIGASNFGSTLVSQVVGRLIPVLGYQMTTIYTAWGIAAIGIFLNLLFLRNPKSPGGATAAQSATQQEDVPGLTISQCFKTLAFWLFGIAMIFGAMLYSGVFTYAVTFFVSNGLAQTTAANYFSMLTVFGGIITMCSGALIKKLGARWLMVFVFGGYILGIILIVMFPANPVPFLALAALFFIAFVRPVNALPSLTLPEMFGRKDFASLSSWGMSFYYVGAGLSSIVIGLISDMTGGNFTMAFAVLGVIAAVSFILFLFALKMSPMKHRKETD